MSDTTIGDVLFEYVRWRQRTGELFAGILTNFDQPGYLLFLLPDVPPSKLNWGDAKKWATSVNGELPTLREQSLLFANCKEQFEANWYWSCEQGAADPDYAWVQNFTNGGQGSGHKSNIYRARAVRRVPII